MRLLKVLLTTFLLLTTSMAAAQEEVTPDTILAVKVEGAINPVLAAFISEQIARANTNGARAFLVEMDTPGGLDTAMRTIIQHILGSRVPVIVYVYPPGARAASAGALIALAADFAVMAPGTNIGAAHPVAIGGGGGGGTGDGEGNGREVSMEKVVQDAVAYARSLARQRDRNEEWAESIVRESISTPAHEALELGAIDLIAEDEQELLRKLDGMTYVRKGEKIALSTEGATLVFAQMGWRQSILNTISNPNVAYLLLMLGILGIFFEISNPGAIFPGAIGGIAILLAFLGLQMLPINYIGVLLLLVAVVLFILEVYVPSYGMLTVGGLISLALGSLILVDSPAPYLQISRAIIAATVGVSAAFMTFVLFFVVRAQKTHFVSGVEGMVGDRGTAVTDVHGEGKVFVHGEYWDAWSDEPIVRGEAVEVVRVDRMRVEVRKARQEVR